ncbi:hypothetical protein NE237_013856 [Protea cynaroides]|uniref:N-acetyltransferase domain-containing protein n=1 Tax=Protea cynaroides TaxID=273540 RepID=A0A9Q0H048_9MAGN|nr:hypothetical protein NE237_013856 [Protea cynaroides]
MDTYIENKVLIREFNEDRDVEAIEKLERSCEVGYRKGISISTNMMGDPLCRIRLYQTHVMLIAELVENRELVGVVRGCMKHVGTGKTHMNMGCILGLRVSPKHRRMGIGLKLVESMESWAIKNGAEYIYLAIEANNVASTNLFVLKCNYIKLSSLVILIQPISFPIRHPPQEVRIEKLNPYQAISLYKSRFGGESLCPADIDVILKEKLSLGTWVSFFGEEEWIGLHGKDGNHDDEFIHKTPSSWAMVSVWSTCATYKLQIRRAYPCKCFHTLSHARAKVFPCLKMQTRDLLEKPFGFLFLYGIHGEGQKVGELMKSLWRFTCNLAGNVEDCKAIITELGVSDPLKGHVPQGTMSCIDDIWYLKRVRGSSSDEDDRWTKMPHEEHLFVDPRDF